MVDGRRCASAFCATTVTALMLMASAKCRANCDLRDLRDLRDLAATTKRRDHPPCCRHKDAVLLHTASPVNREPDNIADAHELCLTKWLSGTSAEPGAARVLNPHTCLLFSFGLAHDWCGRRRCRRRGT